ncbi:LytTR family DNA-binding domain-containing protein [Winogradskyella sp.]|uniref:LytTR family DNA-binding domain-containing protein n=1 Tax=Winogradskyella sp. TaxID=1883156 RepID=UPI00261B4AC2|nr:LytTR family DNA-binding domain-containing protein [Winogradskyella sp.]
MNLKIKLIEDRLLVLRLTLLIFIATFFILFFFEPFGDIKHGFELIGIARVASYALTASMVFFASESYLKPLIKRYLKKGIYTAVYWYFIELFIVAIAIFICRSLWLGVDSMTLNTFLLVLYRVFLIAILPFFLLMVIVFKSNKPKNNYTVVLSSDTKTPEFLNISNKNLLYLKSEDNYTEVVFLESNELHKKLLRGSLTFFQNQLDINFTRIHRSVIINLLAVKYAKINSQGGELTLTDNNTKLRVSRKYSSDFISKWEQYNSQ